MNRRTAVASIIAATWALAACGTQTPDAGVAHGSRNTPHALVDLPSLPEGHPPVPGFSSLPSLPEGHPPVPGFHSTPALPEGHPRCPAGGSLETPPFDAGTEQALHSLPELIST
jgi:hypothetical protein